MIRAHLARERQPVIQPVDRNDLTSAPRSLAMAHAYTPRPPHPWITTLSPSATSTRSSPMMTCASAQLALTTIVSVTLSGTLNTA